MIALLLSVQLVQLIDIRRRIQVLVKDVGPKEALSTGEDIDELDALSTDEGNRLLTHRMNLSAIVTNGSSVWVRSCNREQVLVSSCHWRLMNETQRIGSVSRDELDKINIQKLGLHLMIVISRSNDNGYFVAFSVVV